MAASTSGAVKALIESLSLGLSAYRDDEPSGASLPHVIVHEAIDITPEPAFNQFDDPQGHVTELVQLTLWERWKDETDGSLEESYTLKDALVLGLKGARLTAAPNHVSGVLVQSGHRLPPDKEARLVQSVITLEVRRVLQRV